MRRDLCALAAVAALAVAGITNVAGARGERGDAVLHEPIAPDPADDLAMHVAVEGDLPAAIHTSGGVVGAPDPLRLPSPWDLTYGLTGAHDAFAPDTDTRRPAVTDYDDPFTPSTTPFKRLEAFDTVLADYHLEVRDRHLARFTSPGGDTPPSADEDAFYADLVVDVPAEGTVRIPSVGPGARVVRARLGVGGTEMQFEILRDGADNWFLQKAPAGGPPHGAAADLQNQVPVRARLVMELAIARAAFGGRPGDAAWSDLTFVAPLPDDVARDAAIVRAAIGVSRSMRPREAIARLVDYFRGFTDSVEAPRPRGSMYLDLALSKKGVCRHRAYAFMITAQSLGIPARFVENETHAWVEIHDGTSWRRIDLGGAGRLSASAASRLAQRERYVSPSDAFAWPQRSEPATELLSASRAMSGQAPATGAGTGAGATLGGPGVPPAAAPRDRPDERRDDDHRVPSTVAIALGDAVVHRGVPLHLRGSVRADDEPCAHVAVELSLRSPSSGRSIPLGTLATGSDGAFEGAVVPAGVPLGDYELYAETPGDARCGRGRN
jgi:transglutaminase-like putative cysteine protease